MSAAKKSRLNECYSPFNSYRGHVADRFLSNISIRWSRSVKEWINLRMIIMEPTMRTTDIGAIYDDEQFFNNYLELRAKPGNYNDLIEQPCILDLVGDITGKKVIDIGCGFGTLTFALSKLKPLKVVGIDNSVRMLELAKRVNPAQNIEYKRLNAENLITLGEKFDMVCSSLMFHYIEDLSSMVKSIREMLCDGGRLIFSQEHPILTAGEMGVTVTDLSEGVNIKKYSLDGERHVKWLGKKVVKYHRKISTILNILLDNGFIIEKILEPVPSPDMIEENKRMLTELQRPSYLMIKAVKGVRK